jgi:predicted O-methyltransferase YrrM
MISKSLKILHEQGLKSFFKKAIESIDNRCFNGKIKYNRCLRYNRVYFGPVHAAIIGNPLRHYYMQETIRLKANELKGEKLRVLEIGSWAGQSATIWAQAIDKYYQRNGEVICVDPWINYLDNIKGDGIIEAMRNALISGEIFNLFNHNIQASGYSDIVFSFRGWSDDRLKMLREDLFDIVFIDGNHIYRAVKQDLENGARILKMNGILCGDDLELQYDQVDQKTCKSNLTIDLIEDPRTRKLYHPGVTLAAWEFFLGSVSDYEGYWLMKKSDGKWKEAILPIPDPRSRK